MTKDVLFFRSRSVALLARFESNGVGAFVTLHCEQQKGRGKITIPQEHFPLLIEWLSAFDFRECPKTNEEIGVSVELLECGNVVRLHNTQKPGDKGLLLSSTETRWLILSPATNSLCRQFARTE